MTKKETILSLVEEVFDNYEWKDTGKEYCGFTSPELFVDNKPTGMTVRGLQEQCDDLAFMSDVSCMNLLGMKDMTATWDPQKELVAIMRSTVYGYPNNWSKNAKKTNTTKT